MLLTIQAPNFSEDASSFRIRILKDLYLLGDIRRFYWIRSIELVMMLASVLLDP